MAAPARDGELDRGAEEITRALDLLGDQPERAVRGLAAMAGPYLGTASIAEHRASLGRVEGITDHLPTQASRTALLATTLGGRLIVGDRGTWERIAQLPSASDVHDPDELHHLTRAHCNRRTPARGSGTTPARGSSCAPGSPWPSGSPPPTSSAPPRPRPSGSTGSAASGPGWNSGSTSSSGNTPTSC
ncbi:hypothetical protein ABZ816_15655 [Actinosynnema sp. NPDC047251]|uniref:Uncharacterized protein n=1 Tax=Saccharothrix espanaensis (strain ATCC 51144 / DSM 44229 / JCM 9112 / NBRC 15066 / NRRL 15764) TaxID=1179773 RepID=K0JXV5_SACES|nr:hypothetical protein [Saccharothrix espanaensis]CCH29544.1 hypothetical protein BN6_22230 [Saccharothrix espanaensis DSM 44229]